MAKAERRAEVTWQGNLVQGSGRAHASCFAMALSHGLAQGGTPPERLHVSAVSTFEQVEGGFRITTMNLDVQGKVPGLDQAGFEAAARQAGEGCPVSNALRNNVDIRVRAYLEA